MTRPAVIERPRTRPAAVRSRRNGGVILVAASVVVVLSLVVGARGVDPTALWMVDHPDHAVMVARLDRTLMALAVGAALALAGSLMQGLTRNPLADPGILGVNAGAAFAMVLGITYLGATGLGQYIWYGFVGAAVAAVMVHVIASLGRDGATPPKLAIAGAAMTAGLTSWTTAVMLLHQDTLDQIRRWQVGTVAGRDTSFLLTAAPFLVIGLLLALASLRSLDALALGDEVARGLGRNVVRDRIVVGTAIVMLAGAATAAAGPIAFLGLIVPHLVRRLVGSSYVRLVPMALVVGAVLMVAADTVGRVVLPPDEVEVGVMCAVLGAPVFLVMIRRGRMGAL